MRSNRNFKTVKIPVRVIVLIVCIIVFAAAIWIFSLFRFPAKKYVKSALNAVCYDETENYKKITNSDTSEVDEAIEADLQFQAEAFAAYFGVENLSNKSIEILKEFSKNVYSYGKFKVTGAKKTKDGYTVTVKVKPILFSEISQKNVDKYIEEFNQRAEDGEFLYDSDAIYEEEFLEGLLKVYKEELENIEYGKYEKITVTVEKTSKNRYSTDLTDVINALIKF